MANSNNHTSGTEWRNTVPAETRGQLTAFFTRYINVEPVSRNDPEEVKNRLTEYFQACAENEIIPSVEGMCSVLGHGRKVLLDWERVPGLETGRIISQAKSIINSILATAAIENKSNAVFSIWSQKNHFGYSDGPTTISIETPPDKPPLTAADLPNLSIVREGSTDSIAPGLPEITIINETEGENHHEV